MTIQDDTLSPAFTISSNDMLSSITGWLSTATLSSPTLNDTLSSILGWTSVACWIFVYTPQIYENYTLSSGEGLSLFFVLIWTLGDFTNMTGAALAGLLPTQIILAVYYNLCDAILISQTFYYRRKSSTSRPGTVSEDDQTPLLTDSRTSKSDHEPFTPIKVLVLRYTGALLFVIATGVLAWWFSSHWETSHEIHRNNGAAMTWTIQILGWTSAVCYLSSRVPQIIRNFTTRCEGLAPGLFLFAMLGNTTYTLSILVKSLERDYLLINASWLAGSVSTIMLDVIVLSQFIYFRYKAMKARGR